MIENRQWRAAYNTARSIAIITQRHTTVHKTNGTWCTGYADEKARITKQTMQKLRSQS